MAEAYNWKDWAKLLPGRAVTALRNRLNETQGMADPQALLMHAARQDSVSTLQSLKHLHLQMRAVGETFFTAEELTDAAHEAVRAHNAASLKCLLGFYTAAEEVEPTTPEAQKVLLHAAVASANLAVIEEVLRWGADIEKRNKNDETPLAFAVLHPGNNDDTNRKIARLLGRYGAEPNPDMARFGSLFTHAIAKLSEASQKRITGLMLELNADFDRPDARGNVIAHHLWDDDFFGKGTQKSHGIQILERMRDLEHPDAQGNTLFLNAAAKSRSAAKSNSLMLHALHDRGVNIHAVNHAGQNAVHLLVRSGLPMSSKPIQTLDHDLPDHTGRTPLLLAVEKKLFWIVSDLVARDDVDLHRTLPENGNGVLHLLLNHLALIDGMPPERAQLNESLFVELLTGGADVTLKNAQGTSALELANGLRQEIQKELESLPAPDADGKEQYPAIVKRFKLIDSLADQVEGFPALCRGRHLYDQRFAPVAFSTGQFVENSAATPLLLQLAGAGILHEAFAPCHWQGREAEALATIEPVLAVLPEFQRSRYREMIDRTPYLPAPDISETRFANAVERTRPLGERKR